MRCLIEGSQRVTRMACRAEANARGLWRWSELTEATVLGASNNRFRMDRTKPIFPAMHMMRSARGMPLTVSELYILGGVNNLLSVLFLPLAVGLFYRLPIHQQFCITTVCDVSRKR